MYLSTYPESKMELTLKDRLMLVNQYMILEKLYPHDADHYASLRTAVASGYVLHYADCVEWFFGELSKDDCREVLDILSMYSSLNFGFKDLHAASGIDLGRIKFIGFDGNNEAKLVGYTNYLIEDLGKFEELKNHNPGFNSHCPMLEQYRGMLAEWRRSADRYNLNEADIQRIVGAR
jgi:uncharacterized protein